jgi:hypothetical protein
MSTETQQHPLAALEPQATPRAKEHQIFKQSDRIMLGTPCYGGNVKQEFMTSITDLMMHLSARFYQEDGTVALQPLVAEMAFLENESHIDRARNKIANRFMSSRCDWLLFIDSDIVFRAEDVMRLWLHGMNGKRIVCGAYAMKGIVPQFAVAAVPGAKTDEHGLIEVVHSGTGFMLIHREVFQKLEAAGKAQRYNLGTNDPDRARGVKTNLAYFKSGVRPIEPVGDLWLSEDYMLCYEWRKLDGKIYIDRNINLEHCGSLKFPPDPRQIAAAMKELRRVNAPGLPEERL